MGLGLIGFAQLLTPFRVIDIRLTEIASLFGMTHKKVLQSDTRE